MFTKHASRILAGALVLAASLTGASSASAADTYTSWRTGTCLNRSSDHFDGCWLSSESPSANGYYKFRTSGCYTYEFQYDPSTPASAYGVPRVDYIAGATTWLVNDAYSEAPMSGWVGFGGTARSPAWANVGLAPLYLHLYVSWGNRFANVRVRGVGNPTEGCRWM